MTNRLARFHVNPLFAWVVPGLAVVVVTGSLFLGGLGCCAQPEVAYRQPRLVAG